MFRIISCLLISVLMTSGFTAPAWAKSTNNKYASIVMDADTGMILSQRYADKPLHPASLTKMMTLLLTFEALDRGDIRKKDRIRISRHAASMVPSKLGLPAGSSIRVEDAIYALVTKSANDVAVALAEHLGGTESRFAVMMTSRARTIGMGKTNFRNASGLHHPSQVSSARDMAKMARYILKRYPHYYGYFSTKNFTYEGKTYRNHNRLMNTYKGMDGFKTGYINASGFNLVASAKRDGRRLIGVVFGGRSTQTRNDHMAEILDAGFAKADKVRIASVKTPPLPPSKPGYGSAQLAQAAVAQHMAGPKNFTSLSAIGTQTQPNNDFKPNYTELSQALEKGRFGELIGQGDIDPAVSKRLETGLIAVAVHKGEYEPNPEPATAVEQSLRDAGHAMVSKMGHKTIDNDNTNIPSLPHPRDLVGKWSIQIGAFKSRVDTDQALGAAKAKLPQSLSKASPMAVPLRTPDGLIFRARFGGLSQEQASQACEYLKDCMTVAPSSQHMSAR